LSSAAFLPSLPVRTPRLLRSRLIFFSYMYPVTCEHAILINQKLEILTYKQMAVKGSIGLASRALASRIGPVSLTVRATQRYRLKALEVEQSTAARLCCCCCVLHVSAAASAALGAAALLAAPKRTSYNHNLRDPHASKRQSRVRAKGLVAGVRSCRCAARTE
jgi:hypothetical protein